MGDDRQAEPGRPDQDSRSTWAKARHRQNVTICSVFLLLGIGVLVMNLAGDDSGSSVRDSPWVGVVAIVVFGGLLARELRNPRNPT